MAYLFPSSPSVGATANGFTWDGEKWSNTPSKIDPNVLEQFVDLNGLTTKDITVPSWATAVEIDGALYVTTGGSWPQIQVSGDGSTFLTTSGNYAHGGNVVQSGSTPNISIGTVDAPGLTMGFTADNAVGIMPHLVECLLTVRKPNTTPSLFSMKAISKAYDSPAANSYRTPLIHSYVKNAAIGTALQLKALRISLNGAGNYTAGSFLRFRWVGDVSQIATGGGIEPEANSCAITCNANQAISSAAFAKVAGALNSVVHDPTGMWDNTNKRIIPKKQGLYLFSGLVSIETLPAAVRMVTAVYKNGSLAALLGRGSTGASAIAGFGGAVPLIANGTTDYFELWVYHNAGSDQNVVGVIGSGYAGYTHFEAVYLGGTA